MVVDDDVVDDDVDVVDDVVDDDDVGDVGDAGVAVISGFRVKLIDPWPAGEHFTGANVTDSSRFLGRVSQYSVLSTRYSEALSFSLLICIGGRGGWVAFFDYFEGFFFQFPHDHRASIIGGKLFRCFL